MPSRIYRSFKRETAGRNSVIPAVTFTRVMTDISLTMSDAVTDTVLDITAPSVPGSPQALYTPGIGVTLTWTASTDNLSGLDRYFIKKNGSAFSDQPAYLSGIDINGDGQDDDNVSLLDLDGVVGDQYQIAARDVAQNVSSYSSAVTAFQLNETPLEVLVDFADGTTGGRNTTGRIYIVSSPIRKTSGGISVGSDYSMRSYMDKNQVGYGTSALKRAEIAQLYEKPPLYVPIWYGWSIYFNNPFPLPDIYGPNGRRLTTWEIVTQFHPSGAFAFGNPTCALNSYPNRNYLSPTQIDYSHDLLWLSVIGDDNVPASVTTSYQTNRRFELIPVQPGRWMDFVMRVVWDFRKLPAQGGVGIGHVQYWVNGTRYVNTSIQNCFNEPAAGAGNIGPYMKMGMYKGWDIAANVVSDSVYASPGTREFFHYGLRIALESKGANYSTVDPVTNYGARP